MVKSWIFACYVGESDYKIIKILHVDFLITEALQLNIKGCIQYNINLKQRWNSEYMNILPYTFYKYSKVN